MHINHLFLLLRKSLKFHIQRLNTCLHESDQHLRHASLSVLAVAHQNVIHQNNPDAAITMTLCLQYFHRQYMCLPENLSSFFLFLPNDTTTVFYRMIPARNQSHFLNITHKKTPSVKMALENWYNLKMYLIYMLNCINTLILNIFSIISRQTQKQHGFFIKTIQINNKLQITHAKFYILIRITPIRDKRSKKDKKRSPKLLK